mmetsp:Transcript_2450/g.7846  ORF Transcript_2450/g.7846 Transcript_2450/m.7846 type:complete len:218 (+) Transcript_2450:2254-2907(+)
MANGGDFVVSRERLLSVTVETVGETEETDQHETDCGANRENWAGDVRRSDDDFVLRRLGVYDSVLQRIFQSWIEKRHRRFARISVRERVDAGYLRHRSRRSRWVRHRRRVRDHASHGTSRPTHRFRHRPGGLFGHPSRLSVHDLPPYFIVNLLRAIDGGVHYPRRFPLRRLPKRRHRLRGKVFRVERYRRHVRQERGVRRGHRGHFLRLGDDDHWRR